MSSSGSGERTQLKLVTIGDFDPQVDYEIEYDFIGRVIAGRYTIRANIGGGGMADVFRATDEELGVDVAIKLLKPRMASDELRARMVQEARAAAQVRHANLVRVFGTGKLDSTAYIVMELLAGPNLEQYLRGYPDRRLPWRQALELLLPALDALHAIHERGYVHRDIKTGNILVTHEPGRPPTAVVIDLGLVKANRALRDAASPPTTEIGRMLCTPGYTSPEQAAGNPVDRRSDIYSMAVTLYRVLAGRLPFHAGGQPVTVVLAKHIHNEPTRLVKAAAGADIPRALARVIESALHKRPENRPPTMLAFADALRAVAASEASGAAPVRRPRERLLGLGLGLGLAVTWLATGPTMERAPGASDAMLLADEPGEAARSEPVTIPAIDAHPEATSAVVSERSSTSFVASLDTGPTSEAPAPGPPEVVPQPSRQSALRKTWRRVVTRRGPDVQRCADLAAGSLQRLTVSFHVDTTGRISAQAVDAADSPLSRCLDTAFRETLLLAPEHPSSFRHEFKLRALSDNL